MKTICLLSGVVLSAVCAMPAAADQYLEYPAPTPFYPFQRSFVTGRLVAIPPYDRPFVERVYTTPPQQPYYNVPPYSVVAPY